MASYEDIHHHQRLCPRAGRACLCPAACNQNGGCAMEVPPSTGDGMNPEVQEIEPEMWVVAEPPPPNDSARRKASPVWAGVLNYFPDALLAVSRVSKAGNDKHNPGQPLHWSREKSNDHMDCAARHMLTPYEIDPDSKEIHLANAVWRLLAELQIYQEKQRA